MHIVSNSRPSSPGQSHSLNLINYLLSCTNELNLDLVLNQEHRSFDMQRTAKLASDWYDAFLTCFIEAPPTIDEEFDDMLFFVRESGNPPVFVRRRVQDEIPRIREPVDWPSSFLLNLICQTRYYLVVSVCNKEFSIMEQKCRLIVQRQVIRRVYATHSEIRLGRKHEDHNPPNAYPLIYFGIENVRETFEDFAIACGQVLCVELVASFAGRDAMPRNVEPGSLTNTPTVKPLFQGAVDYDALREGSMQSKTARQLLSPHSTVLMRGPNGKGMCQVVVKDQSLLFYAVSSLTAHLNITSTGKNPSIQCGLVFVNLPASCLAQDLLK